MDSTSTFLQFESIDYGRRETSPSAPDASQPGTQGSAQDTTQDAARGTSARADEAHAGFFGRIVRAVTAWNDVRVTRKVLSGLDDHMLDDIGLTRADIDDLGARYQPAEWWWWHR